MLDGLNQLRADPPGPARESDDADSHCDREKLPEPHAWPSGSTCRYPMRMIPDLFLRQATRDDAAALAALSTQLGYPSTSDQVQARLSWLISTDDIILVAESNDRVVGWIHMQVSCTVEANPNAEIAGLVVDESCRGQGVGSALVEEGCLWAKRRGMVEVRVRSNVLREEAHRFYEGQGFQRLKTQIVFSRRSEEKRPKQSKKK